MTSTSVGMRCPECASQRTRVSQPGRRRPSRSDAPATYALIAICVAAFIAEFVGGGTGGARRRREDRSTTAACSAAAVADGEHVPDRHLGLPARRAPAPRPQHVRPLHPRHPARAGDRDRCGSSAIYAVSMLGGSFGALLLDPNELTVGASGGDLRADGGRLLDRAPPRPRRARLAGRVLRRHQPRLHVQHPATSASAATSAG